MGVAVRRYIDFLILFISTPLVLALFCSSISTFCSFFLNVFLFLFMVFLCKIANVAQRAFKIVQKSRSCRHGNIIISTSTSTTCPETSTWEVPSDILQKLTLCMIMAS